MKTKKSILIYPLFVTGFLLIPAIGCKWKHSHNIVKDIDGNVYHTVTICKKVWMVGNLKTTKYRDGTPIPNVIGTWGSLTTGAYCNYANTPSNSNTYGRLYNWYAVNDSRNLAPVGWHIATQAEWATLRSCLGVITHGHSTAGSKLKEAGTAHWQSPNAGATNSTGFTALPGGSRSNSGFGALGQSGGWWSSTGYTPNNAFYVVMDYMGPDVYFYDDNKTTGYSVRCVKD